MRFVYRFQVMLLLGVLLWSCRAWPQTHLNNSHVSLSAAVADLKGGDLRAAEVELLKNAQVDSHNPELYNLLGFIYDQTNRTDRAIQEYQKALAIAPNFTAARNNLGSAYIRQGKFTLAISQFQTTVRSRPYDATANYNLGLIYLDQEAYSQAERHLNVLRTVSPKDPGVLLNLTRAYFGQGKQVDALRTATEFRDVAGNDAGGLFRMGIVLAANHEYKQAVSDLTAADQLAPRTPMFLFALAQAQSKLGQDDAAIMSLDKLIRVLTAAPEEVVGTDSFLDTVGDLLLRLRQHDPGASRSDFLLGEIQFLTGRYALAIRTLEPLRRTYKTNADYFNLMGMCYAELNQFSKAIPAVAEAITLEPKRAPFYFNLASIYQKAGKSQAAIAILNPILARGGSSPLIPFSLGVSYFNLGSYAAAIEKLKRAAELDPHFPQAEFFIGRCYEKLDRPLNAAAAYRTAVTLDPGFYQADYRLALLSVHSGRMPQAVSFLRTVVRINPGYPDAHYQLGTLYAAQGHTSQAASELEEAIALNPGYDSAYYRLGRLYKRIGNTKRARELLRIVTAHQQARLEAYQKKVSGSGQ